MIPQWLLFSAGLALAVLSAPALVRRYICFKIIVPTASMAPAIEPGDHILVRRITEAKKLRRGDLLVFRSTHRQIGDGSLLMIKRLIGLPGETVELDQGRLLINGTPIPEEYIRYQKEFEGSFEIPRGHYFFLGDNRSSSHDGRYWEEPYVRGIEIIARAGVRIWPIRRFGFIQ